MKKTWADFVKWLEEQPPERMFQNDSSSHCVGHAFMVEHCRDNESCHTISDVDDVLDGFTEFFEQMIVFCCPHTGDGEHQLARDLLRLAMEFKL